MPVADKPSDTELRDLLGMVKTRAVVGLSSDASRDSHRVASYLKRKGYKVIPVNPSEPEILGEESYPDLKSIPESVDVVDVFRRPEFVPDIATEAVRIGAKVLWLQLGIRSDAAAEKAREAGLTVIQDACMLQEHSRLLG